MTAETNRASSWRFPTASLLAATLGVAGHVAGAGELPTATPIVLGVLAIATGAAGLARWSGARRRWCWEALTVLWLGQLAVETLLVCEAGPLDRPLAATGVHAAAGLVVGGLMLGGRRIVDDTAAVLDVLPLHGWAGPTGPAAPTRVPCAPGGSTAFRTLRRIDVSPVRGPPRSV
ncbi:hypothetical protein GCM10023199_41920 [Actinomycetospora chibensis]